MDTLTYTFKIQGPATSPAVIVVGGADSNRDGTISNTDEVAAFVQQPDGVTWTRSQNVAGATAGMAFAVHFVVGEGVPWQLTIANAAGQALFSSASTTIWAFDTVSYFL